MTFPYQTMEEYLQHQWQYCGNPACAHRLGYYFGQQHCQDCGEELVPCIICLCREQAFNLRLLPKHCVQCGAKLTTEYLGRCMQRQLGQMASVIAKWLSAVDILRN